MAEGLIGQKVDALDADNDDHRRHLWLDKDGDVWAWSIRMDDWSSWHPGDFRSLSYASPDRKWGPYVCIAPAWPPP